MHIHTWSRHVQMSERGFSLSLFSILIKRKKKNLFMYLDWTLSKSGYPVKQIKPISAALFAILFQPCQDCSESSQDCKKTLVFVTPGVCLIAVWHLGLKTRPNHFLFCVVSTSFCHHALSLLLCLSVSLSPTSYLRPPPLPPALYPSSWCLPPVCMGPPRSILCLLAACHVQCVSRALMKE